MDILFNESDPDTFGFQIDTYWVQAGGGDPIYWINKVRDRMPIVHLKDMGIDTNKNLVFMEIGEGNLNWSGILEACKSIGVEWYCVEQDRCQRNPFESIEISLKNLKGLGL
jgi:sugar phosphate isomerase/epimerase